MHVEPFGVVTRVGPFCADGTSSPKQNPRSGCRSGVPCETV
jgi:hypothetical protein